MIAIDIQFVRAKKAKVFSIKNYLVFTCDRTGAMITGKVRGWFYCFGIGKAGFVHLTYKL